MRAPHKRRLVGHGRRDLLGRWAAPRPTRPICRQGADVFTGCFERRPHAKATASIGGPGLDYPEERLTEAADGELGGGLGRGRLRA
jgi:hypothetical protein